MLKKKLLKISRSIIKIFLPLIFKILIKFKINRRVISYLQDKSYFGNQKYDFSGIIRKLLKSEKLIALDVGAQGGFNSDNFFSKKYNIFFEPILVEPIKSEAKKLSGKCPEANASCLEAEVLELPHALDQRSGEFKKPES